MRGTGGLAVAFLLLGCAPAVREQSSPAVELPAAASTTLDGTPQPRNAAPSRAPAEAEPRRSAAPEAIDLDQRLAKAARGYGSFARVGDVAWAPALCADMASGGGGMIMAPPALSRAAASSAHGEKVFWVYTQDRDAYLNVTHGRRSLAPVGMAVVKEAWRAERDDTAGVDLSRTVKKDGHVYRASAKVGLFLMVKAEPSTPGTDGGWIYGTASADGSAVRRATAADTCAGCHASAAHDRLFGPAGG